MCVCVSARVGRMLTYGWPLMPAASYTTRGYSHSTPLPHTLRPLPRSPPGWLLCGCCGCAATWTTTCGCASPAGPSHRQQDTQSWEAVSGWGAPAAGFSGGSHMPNEIGPNRRGGGGGGLAGWGCGLKPGSHACAKPLSQIPIPRPATPAPTRISAACRSGPHHPQRRAHTPAAPRAAAQGPATAGRGGCSNSDSGDRAGSSGSGSSAASPRHVPAAARRSSSGGWWCGGGDCPGRAVPWRSTGTTGDSNGCSSPRSGSGSSGHTASGVTGGP